MARSSPLAPIQLNTASLPSCPPPSCKSKARIAIIGAGWFGCHIGITLANKGYKVTILESNSDIFSGISGTFGLRLQSGPHYPRSAATRKSCQKHFHKFIEEYGSILNFHEYSVYGLGRMDAKKLPAKVSADQFAAVCAEVEGSQQVDLDAFGYTDELQCAFDVPEPTLKAGAPLREDMRGRLQRAGVKVKCDIWVSQVWASQSLKRIQWKSSSGVDMKSGHFDVGHVVNATSYKALLPNDPLPFDVVYQPRLGLVYNDMANTYASAAPIGFIVMDGCFPCIMPLDDVKGYGKQSRQQRKYMLVHGNWTAMASCSTLQEAELILQKIDSDWVERNVQTACTKEMARFWPEFAKRFKYDSWKGTVLALLKTDKEFRSALTFRHKASQMVYVFPGNINNVYDAAYEVEMLIKNEHVESDDSGKYEWIKDGVLSTGLAEVCEKPHKGREAFSTSHLNTFEEVELKEKLKVQQQQIVRSKQ